MSAASSLLTRRLPQEQRAVPTQKLTQRFIDDLVAAEPDVGDVFYWDERLPGFGAKRKGGSGSVSFVIQWREKKSGRSHRLALGDARKMSLDGARKAAKARFEQIAAGDNPVEARQQHRAALTFDQLAERYQQSDEWKRKAESTRLKDAYRVNHALRPFFGGKRLSEIGEEECGRLGPGQRPTGSTAAGSMGNISTSTRRSPTPP